MLTQHAFALTGNGTGNQNYLCIPALHGIFHFPGYTPDALTKNSLLTGCACSGRIVTQRTLSLQKRHHAKALHIQMLFQICWFKNRTLKHGIQHDHAQTEYQTDSSADDNTLGSTGGIIGCLGNHRTFDHLVFHVANHISSCIVIYRHQRFQQCTGLFRRAAGCRKHKNVGALNAVGVNIAVNGLSSQIFFDIV